MMERTCRTGDERPYSKARRDGVHTRCTVNVRSLVGWREEYEAAHLDALPRRCVRRQGIVEGCVEGGARPAGSGGVVHANQPRLGRLHVREIVPTMPRPVFDRRRLAAHMRVDEVAGDQVVVAESPRIAERERRVLHRPPDGTPDMCEPETLLAQ